MKLALNVFLGLAFCICMGFSSSLKRENRNIAGKSVDSMARLGPSKIHFHIRGNGRPSVVFVSGLGDDYSTWHIVQDTISKAATTLSYDRSGLGLSEYHGEGKNLLSLARELHSLVDKIGFKKPFIIVGHSLGCQIVKEYCSFYPLDVNGVVFVDPGYNEDNLKASISDSLWKQREAALKLHLPVFNIAQTQELKFVNKSSKLSDSIKILPKVPITIFTATLVTDFPASAMEYKIKSQTHLAWLKTIPWAEHIFVPESRHYIQEDAPMRVISAIRKMSFTINREVKKAK